MNLQPTKTEFTDAEHAEIRSKVQAEIKGDAGLTQAEIARQAELHASTLNEFLKGTYKGQNNNISAALTKWLNGRRRAAALRSRLPIAPMFQPLYTSTLVLSLLDIARETGRIVQITGAPGVSKTASARQYSASNNRAWLATMDPSTSGVPTMLLEILSAMGEEDAKGTPQILAKRVLAEASKAKCLIIIDEAQHLSDKAIEQVRAINDAARRKGVLVGIALLGNEKVVSKIGGTGGKAEFAQVSSRISQRRFFVRPDPRDVKDLAEAWAAANNEHLDQPTMDFCQKIAATPGGLRNVEMTFENALLVTLAAGEPLQLEHMKGAFQQLSGLNL